MQARSRVIPDAEQALVGAYLRRIRLKAGITQAELADHFGMKQNYVSRLERGERPIQFVEFVLIARRLGLEPDAAVREYVDSLPLLSTLAPPSRVRRS